MAEKRTIELEIQDNSKSLKTQYKEAVAELQKMSTQYGETSKEAVKAAKAAADLKDQIAFSKDLVDAFNPDAKFKAVEGAVNGVMNGFQAFTGGMALLGVESDKVEEALLKVQSVMALTQGINGLMEAGDSFKQLGAAAKSALSGIKAGIAATGIGLLLIAVGTLYAYWDDIKEAVSGVSKEQTALNKKTEANLKAADAKVDLLNKQDNILKLQGKTEKQILQIKLAALDIDIAAAEVNLKSQKTTLNAQYQSAKANKEILIGIMNFLNAPLKLLLGTIEMVGKAMGKEFHLIEAFNIAQNDTANLIFDPAGIKAEGEAAIKEAEVKLVEMKNTRAGYEIQIKAIEQQGAASSISTASGAAKEIKDITFDLEEERIRLMKDGQQKELDALALQYARKKKEIEKDDTILAKDKAKLLEGLITGQKSDEALINEKYRQLEKEKEKQALQDKIKLQDEQWYALQKLKNSQQEQELLDLQIAYDKEYEAAVNNETLQKELTDKFNKDSAAINKKYTDEKAAADKLAADAEIATAKAVAEQKQAIQNQGIEVALQGVQLIKNVFEKSKGVQKAAVIAESAIGIAKMIIANKLANAGALATPQAIATSGAAAAPVIALNNISTGIGIAANIAATAKALKSLGGGSAPNAPAAGGGGGAGGGGSITPQFNTVGNNGINQLAQLQQQPTMAYVVSGQVTSQQALDRNRAQNSSL
jgi:hypothetical protein